MAASPEKEKKARRPTALKRLIQSEKKRMINKSFTSKMRTAIRGFETACKAGDTAALEPELNKVYSLLDKGVKKGIVKKNQASRKKSRLALRIPKA